MAAMYAVYHGPSGLRQIANKIHGFTKVLKTQVEALGYEVENQSFFDTLTIDTGIVEGSASAVHRVAREAHINLRHIDDVRVGVTLDESMSADDLVRLINVFASSVSASPVSLSSLQSPPASNATIPEDLCRTSPFLHHPVFNTHHSETEMLRYIHHLQNKDLSLVHAMIPLGSCTMKLNSTSSMIPLTWPEFGGVHPFAPVDQVKGYLEMIKELENDLCKITGFEACSLQPNSGASGEYAGLSVIRKYHESRGEANRNICLIPVSAHGTNPAVSSFFLSS